MTTRLALSAVLAASLIAAHPGPGFSQNAPASGGMGSGMMGQSGPTGMMDGGTGQMMSMMRDMMTMLSAQNGMMVSHAEGRIAALKTDLGITEAQTPQWDRFAGALRAMAESMNGMYGQMMQPGTKALSVRLAAQEQRLSAHLASLKALKDALGPLYASLSEGQKKIADGLMIGPMGMM
jgi:hypothetical protein